MSPPSLRRLASPRGDGDREAASRRGGAGRCASRPKTRKWLRGGLSWSPPHAGRAPPTCPGSVWDPSSSPLPPPTSCDVRGVRLPERRVSARPWLWPHSLYLVRASCEDPFPNFKKKKKSKTKAKQMVLCNRKRFPHLGT